MNTTRIVVNASKTGQQHGALVRAAVINAALTVRDVANTAADATIDYASTAKDKASDVAQNEVAPRAKAATAYAVSFVRTLFAK